MSKYIRTLTVTFDTEIDFKEIPLFRGAVLKSLGDNANILYHNHISDHTFRYSYPLVQYKCLHGKAAVVCIEEGVDLIGQILSELYGTINIGKRQAEYKVDVVCSSKVPLQIENELIAYRLRNWLPLNSQNYRQYQNTEELVEKIKILERVLTGNILSVLKGINIHLEEQLIVHITDIISQKAVSYKKIKLMAFDINFKTNINLPSYIGIGKNASVGCGLLSKSQI